MLFKKKSKVALFILTNLSLDEVSSPLWNTKSLHDDRAAAPLAHRDAGFARPFFVRQKNGPVVWHLKWTVKPVKPSMTIHPKNFEKPFFWFKMYFWSFFDMSHVFEKLHDRILIAKNSQLYATVTTLTKIFPCLPPLEAKTFLLQHGVEKKALRMCQTTILVKIMQALAGGFDPIPRKHGELES